MKIEELDFTVRTYHVLKRAGINTSEEVQRMTDDDLYRLRNVGKLTLAEIRSKLPYIPPEKLELLPTMTNADKIRAMTDEELAAWIVETTYICACCSVSEGCQDAPHVSVCKKNVADWLRQPAKEETT